MTCSSPWAFTFVGVTGEAVDLTDQQARILLGTSPELWGTPPRRTPTATSVGAVTAGAPTIVGVEHDVRRFGVPWKIGGQSPAQLQKDIRKAAELTDPRRGYCRIVATDADGDSREIRCIYEFGLERLSIERTDSSVFARLEFAATDPYWHRVGSTIRHTWTGSDLKPINGTDRRVGWRIQNFGSAPTWPRWRITGPFSRVVARNVTTGRVWGWLGPGVGDTSQGIDVESAEMSASVKRWSTQIGSASPTGEDVYRYVEPELNDISWPFEAGENEIEVDVFGASASSSVTVEATIKDLTC